MNTVTRADIASAVEDVLPLQSFALARFSGLELVPRDRLVSMMLQDRGVMRIISAPHGYGKTLLAYEYARRIFSAGRVVWIDGLSPEFMRALDGGCLVPEENGLSQDADLVVIDDLPILDEQRMETLASCADLCLANGTEIVVTTLPSCDYLRGTQPDRVLITAKDLLVTERDLKGAYSLGSADLRAKACAKLDAAKDAFMGAAPGALWDSDNAALHCLTGFFEESVPREFHKAAFAMLVLGKGSVCDLARIGAKLSDEFEELASKDYLFLGFDSVARTFSCGYVPAALIKQAIEEAGMAQVLLAGSFPVHEKALGLLLETGDSQRVAESMKVFCAGAHCAAWLRDCGLSLVDNGSNALVATLFERCEGQVDDIDGTFAAMRAWLKGMTGEAREAIYYAREAMYLGLQDGSGPSGQKSYLAAQLAMLAFGEAKARDVDLAPLKDAHKAEIASSAAFLVAVASLCKPAELERWAAAFKGGFAPVSQRSTKDLDSDKERLDKLLALFEEHSRRFEHTLAYRVALHMLACVDSSRAFSAVREFGVGALVQMCKRGISTYSEAIVVSDLWKIGYFGASVKTLDVRDAKVLTVTSGLLMKMCRQAGREMCAVPWEQGGSRRVSSNAPSKSKEKKGGSISAQSVPVATVSLFGGLEVVVGEKFVPQDRWTKRSLQLFAILVMNHGKDVSRDVIFNQMWPDLSRSRALDNFYTAWSRMQALLGEGPYLARRGEFCSINTRYVVSDVAEFEQLSRRILLESDDSATLLDIYARMEVIYRGGLLPSERDNAFIAEQRRRFRAMFVDAMLSGAIKSLQSGDSRVALWFARKAIDEDKEREDVYMTLIKAQMAAGQRCSAIRTYFQCKKFLRDELGLDPSAQTQALYDQLIDSDPSLAKLAPVAHDRQASA